MQISITHNMLQIQEELGRYRGQLPFAMSKTMNDTMKDVQKYLRTVTFPRAWTQRNRAFPKAATTITQYANKGKLRVVMEPARSKKNSYVAGEGFLGRQVEGGRKVPKGTAIAIPQIGPGLRRLTGGSIPARKKPKNNRGLIKIGQGLYERQRGELVYRYSLAKSAEGDPRLRRYYPDASKVFERVFSGHFQTNMNRAIATARTRSSGSSGMRTIPTSAAFSNRSI